MGRRRKLLTTWDGKANAARRRRKGIFGLSQQDIFRMSNGTYKKPGRKKKSIFSIRSTSKSKGSATAGAGCLIYAILLLALTCLLVFL